MGKSAPHGAPVRSSILFTAARDFPFFPPLEQITTTKTKCIDGSADNIPQAGCPPVCTKYNAGTQENTETRNTQQGRCDIYTYTRHVHSTSGCSPYFRLYYFYLYTKSGTYTWQTLLLTGTWFNLYSLISRPRKKRPGRCINLPFKLPTCTKVGHAADKRPRANSFG